MTATTPQDELTLRAIAQTLADTLGDEYTLNYDDTGHWPHVDGPDSFSVWLHGPGWAGRDRISVSGQYPVHRPEITCSIVREPSSIVRDILQRFLPAYRELLAAANQQAQEYDAYLDATQETARRFLTFPGITLNDRRSGAGRQLSISTPGCYGGAEVSRDTVRFEGLSTTIDKALRIAAILAEEVGS